jgi:hypothetical protein
VKRLRELFIDLFRIHIRAAGDQTVPKMGRLA